MIHGIGLHRADQAEVVHDLAGVRQQFGKLDAAFPVALEFELRAEQRRVGVDEGGAVIFQQLGGRELAVALGELGFMIEEIEVARGAGVEEEDHALRLRRLRGELGRKGIFCRRGVRVALHELSEGDAAEADAALAEKPAAGEIACGSAVEIGSEVHGLSFW